MNPPRAAFIGCRAPARRAPYIRRPRCSDRIDDEEDLVRRRSPPRAAAAKLTCSSTSARSSGERGVHGLTGAAAFAPRPASTLTTRIDALKASRTGSLSASARP